MIALCVFLPFLFLTVVIAAELLQTNSGDFYETARYGPQRVGSSIRSGFLNLLDILADERFELYSGSRREQRRIEEGTARRRRSSHQQIPTP